jgi:predicted nuclease with TOPRIM domain
MGLDAAACHFLILVLRASRSRRQRQPQISGIAADGKAGHAVVMDDELEKLRAENSELRALVAEQFEGLATMRRELDAVHERFAERLAEIQKLVDHWHRLKEQLTAPTRN